MVDVSLVTSLYRTEAHLPDFLQHARNVWQGMAKAGLTLEFVLVANDATPSERALIEQFRAEVSPVNVLYVERETLYASWNRGVQTAQGQVIGFWNVDDIRTVDGIVQGHARLSQGCKLVYFSHEVIRTTGKREARRIYPAIPYSAKAHRQVMKCGPFFMFHRDLYDEIGGFDERFRITGDFEWCSRATFSHDLCPLPIIGGTFYLHGGNLSDTGDIRQIAENNMTHLLRGTTQYLSPCPPDIMRQTWEKWNFPLDEALKAQLWGDHAAERWQAWQAQKRHAQRMQALRSVPRWWVDMLGLRETLAKLGVVKSRRNNGGQS